ncbi:hypothetical protein SLEP1_g45713 [Rubroshorea leprosula]|uniref:Uncharacterized protein n=1 Tax=Rubroshorea leprosula TaxID=152421 RepID=A0AAV5LJW0_9ROSI|nr:hypothetical protein SLEP1_g45713 [Rubroshorea leprosula]
MESQAFTHRRRPDCTSQTFTMNFWVDQWGDINMNPDSRKSQEVMQLTLGR